MSLVGIVFIVSIAQSYEVVRQTAGRRCDIIVLRRWSHEWWRRIAVFKRGRVERGRSEKVDGPLESLLRALRAAEVGGWGAG